MLNNYGPVGQHTTLPNLYRVAIYDRGSKRNSMLIVLAYSKPEVKAIIKKSYEGKLLTFKKISKINNNQVGIIEDREMWQRVWW